MNTKEKLFNSMYELIAEVGYEKASINQICSNAGIKKSSFYYFYESKESLFLELIKYGYIGDNNLKINEIIKTINVKEYKSKLLNYASSMVNDFEIDIKFRRVVAEIELQSIRNDQVNTLVNAYNNKLKSDLRKILEHGINISAFNNGFDIELNSNILYVIVHGIDSVLLSDIKLDAIKVFNKVIEGLFI